MTTKKDRAKDDLPAALMSPDDVALAPAERAPRPEQTALPDTTPLLTAERAFAGAKRDPVVEAFLHTERAKRPVRKLAKPAWVAELAAFRSAPR